MRYAGIVFAVALLGADAANCIPHVYAPAGTYRQTVVPLHGPGLVLQGGGTDIDPLVTWMHDTLSGGARGRFGNVVVMRAYGDNDYDTYMQALGPFQSVRTIVIPPCADARDVDAQAAYVAGADAVFFSGGDQANYARWKDSALIAAVRNVWARGGVVGGTSAGLAIQGEYAYDSVAADRLHPTTTTTRCARGTRCRIRSSRRSASPPACLRGRRSSASLPTPTLRDATGSDGWSPF
ncbi:MAG: hypothetical protein JO277_02520 [Candidatus Eremiobacteraeota bacterium]|nr:hypothetical protein [Candidatus Eremiobacteraeota bacterium]